MNLPYLIVRVCAVVLGLSLLVSSTADVLGLVPHSNELPPLGARLAKWLKLLLVSTALLVPYRKIRTRATRDLAIIGVGISVFWAAMIGFSGVVEYSQGLKSWHVLPATCILVALVAANAYVFAKITRTSTR